MKQGNGTEILGPDDPRAASIGIIHVSPTDDRKSVLAAIIAQEKFGRKRVAVVLPPLNKAFQRPADFDDLKSMRNRLQTEVVFIAPSGPGPGEFARQRRFPVYSSLDSYAQALREEQPVEETPKKGWFGGPKPKAAEAPPPTPPAPVVPSEEQVEHDAAKHSAAPFIGGAIVGGAGALAADQLLHPASVAGTGSAASIAPGAEDDFQFTPDSSGPPTAPLSPLPPQESVPNVPSGGSSPQPESSEVTPKQPRITGDLSRPAPAVPVPPLQLSPVQRASKQPSSGKTSTVGAAAAAGAAGGTATARPASSQGRRRLAWPLLLLLLLLLTCLLCSGVAFALPKQTQTVTSTVSSMVSNLVNPQPPPATVTITPASKVVSNPYSIQAVTSGASSIQHQVAARQVSYTTPAQQKTAIATGRTQIPATQATGTLTFSNGNLTRYTVAAGTSFPAANGVQVVNDVPAVIPAGTGSVFGKVTVSAHAVTSGTAGDISAGAVDLAPCCGSSAVTVVSSAFTGGKDAQNYSFLKQSDIDSVATPLQESLLPKAQSGLKSQIRASEQPVGSPQCSPKVSSDQVVGDSGVNITKASVTVSVTCTQEVYDQQGVQTLVTDLLKKKVATDQTLAGYALVGTIVTETKVQGIDSNGTVTLAVTAKGEWVYQFSKAQQTALAKSIAGLSTEQAKAKLLSQTGVADVSFAAGVTTLPSDPTQITITILPVAGLSGGGGTPTSGTPTVTGATETAPTGPPSPTPTSIGK